MTSKLDSIFKFKPSPICKACNGTGEGPGWHSEVGLIEGACPNCQGTGHTRSQRMTERQEG